MNGPAEPADLLRPEADLARYRGALGRYTTGVTVMTCRRSDGAPVGVTVNSFTSLSLDPPLVLFCLRTAGRSLPVFLEAGAFAVNVLARQQQDLSIRFAREIDDWAGVDWRARRTGSPILDGSLASFDCRLEASHPGGDHRILIGRVTGFVHDPRSHPLLYDRGRYASLGPLEE